VQFHIIYFCGLFDEDIKILQYSTAPNVRVKSEYPIEYYTEGKGRNRIRVTEHDKESWCPKIYLNPGPQEKELMLPIGQRFRLEF
jgi:hypothetical protein